MGAGRSLCVGGPGLLTWLPSALGGGPGGVEQRPCHWESCPQSPRHLLCVSCLHKRHAGNPAAVHCQEVKDTDSRAVGKAGKDGEALPFSQYMPKENEGERRANSACDVKLTCGIKRKRFWSTTQSAYSSLDNRKRIKWAGLPSVHRAETHHF